MYKDFDNNLNAWLSAILVLNAFFALMSVCNTIWKLFSGGEEVILWYRICDIVLLTLFIFGCFKLFFASRVGFYIIVSVCLVNIITGGFLYYHYGENIDGLASVSLKMVLNNIGKIVFFMLLMLLRDKGKNAYQVLWNTKD